MKITQNVLTENFFTLIVRVCPKKKWAQHSWDVNFTRAKFSLEYILGAGNSLFGPGL